MAAAVNKKRLGSRGLTAAAGLLLLVTAVVMMVCAAPRVHASQHGDARRGELVSWAFLTPGSPAEGPAERIPHVFGPQPARRPGGARCRRPERPAASSLSRSATLARPGPPGS